MGTIYSQRSDDLNQSTVHVSIIRILKHTIATTILLLTACSNPGNETNSKSVWISKGSGEPTQMFEISAASSESEKGFQPRKSQTREITFVSNSPMISNSDIERARVESYQLSGIKIFQIQLELSESGGKRFAELTGNRIGKQIALMVNGVVKSAPLVHAKVESRIMSIEGFQSQSEAEQVMYAILGVQE